MTTRQGWGWLTAGVLALGLNGFYLDGGAVWAHKIVDQVAERSGALVDLASERVDQVMEGANLVAARDEDASSRLAAAVARLETRIARTQTGLAHFGAMSARQEAVLARAQAERARIEADMVRVQIATGVFRPMMVRVMQAPVVCPRVQVSVPRVPMVKIPAPVVHVVVLGAGPV
jgi:hypothetical protein